MFLSLRKSLLRVSYRTKEINKPQAWAKNKMWFWASKKELDHVIIMLTNSFLHQHE